MTTSRAIDAFRRCFRLGAFESQRPIMLPIDGMACRIQAFWSGKFVTPGGHKSASRRTKVLKLHGIGLVATISGTGPRCGDCACKDVNQSEASMEKSVYEARWLLGPLLVLCLSITTMGFALA